MEIKVADRTNAEYITVMQAARRLGISRHAVYRLILRNKILYSIIAGHYCIPEEEIGRLTQEQHG